jgi:hypothetical protein
MNKAQYKKAYIHKPDKALIKLGFKHITPSLYNEHTKYYDGFTLCVFVDKQGCYYAEIETDDNAIIQIPDYITYEFIENFDKENS